MGRGEGRGGTEEIRNRNGCKTCMVQCFISLCTYLRTLGTCEVLNQQQKRGGG